PKGSDQPQGGGSSSRRQQKQQKVARGMRNQPPPEPKGGQVARNNPGGGRPQGSGSPKSQMGPFPEDPRTAGGQPDVSQLIRDIWGHLPDSKRAEMDAYAREKFMAKYDALIRKYYETLSETSRRAAEGK